MFTYYYNGQKYVETVNVLKLKLLTNFVLGCLK